MRMFGIVGSETVEDLFLALDSSIGNFFLKIKNSKISQRATLFSAFSLATLRMARKPQKKRPHLKLQTPLKIDFKEFVFHPILFFRQTLSDSHISKRWSKLRSGLQALSWTGIANPIFTPRWEKGKNLLRAWGWPFLHCIFLQDLQAHVGRLAIRCCRAGNKSATGEESKRRKTTTVREMEIFFGKTTLLFLHKGGGKVEWGNGPTWPLILQNGFIKKGEGWVGDEEMAVTRREFG